MSALAVSSLTHQHEAPASHHHPQVATWPDLPVVLATRSGAALEPHDAQQSGLCALLAEPSVHGDLDVSDRGLILEAA